MEDQNELTFRNSSLPTRSYDFFKSMRNKTESCDITLQIGDKSISAHLLIIAAAIPYFRAAFSRKVSASEIDFPDVDPATFESLLDYAYTCEIVITTKNVQNVLYGACCLHVEEVREACCTFLIERLRPGNVLNIQKFAVDLKCESLLRETGIYVRENFAEVSKTEEFLNLPFSYVNQLLESDALHVANEEEVFEAAMKWTKECPEQRRDHLIELLKKVRILFLSPLYIKDHVAKEDLIRTSFPCRDLLDEARDFQNFPEESVCSLSTVARLYGENSSKSETHNKERIYAIYGKHLYTAKYLENTQSAWDEKRSECFRYNGTSTAVGAGKMYLFRKGDVISYSPTSNEYESWAPMPSGRIFVGASELCDKIYVCGGTTNSSTSDIVECYDPKTNEWEKIANMRERRQYPGVATLEKCIYVSGGFNKFVVHKSVEKKGTGDRRWKYVRPMLSERYGHGFTALSGKLYACGGKKSKSEYITSAEVYDPVENKWSFIAPMNMARFCFKLLPYYGKLYAIGGFDDQSKQLGTVEIYDPRTDEWKFGDAIDSAYFVSAEVST